MFALHELLIKFQAKAFGNETVAENPCREIRVPAIEREVQCLKMKASYARRQCDIIGACAKSGR